MTGKNPLILHDNIEVEILNESFQRIGEAHSLQKAAQMCYINRSQSIWRYLYIKASKGRSPNRENGIKSKVTGKRYHFKLK